MATLRTVLRAFPDALTSCVVLLCIAGLISLNLSVIGSTHLSIRGNEPNTLFGVQRVLQGEALYVEPTAPPFSVTQKAPGYYWPTAQACRLLSIGADDPYQVTRVGRALSSCFSMLMLGMLGTLLLRARARLAVVIGMLGCVYASIVPFHWLVRGDALADFLFMGSVCLSVGALRWGLDSRKGELLLAAATATGWLATLCKQDAILSVVVLGTFLTGGAVLRRFSWRSVAIVAGVSALALMSMAALAIASDVSLLVVKHNIVDGVRNGIDVETAFRKAIRPVFSSWAIVIACLILAGASLGRAQPQLRASESYLLFACAVVLVVSALASLKIGTSVNKYARFMILAAFTVSYLSATREVFSNPLGPALRWGFCAWICLSLAVVTVQQLSDYKNQPTTQSKDYARFVRDMKKQRRRNGDFRVLTITPVAHFIPSLAYAPQYELARSAHQQLSSSYKRLESDLRSRKVRYVASESRPNLERDLGIKTPRLEKRWTYSFGAVYENLGY